jgi:hypothetical protein
VSDVGPGKFVNVPSDDIGRATVTDTRLSAQSAAISTLIFIVGEKMQRRGNVRFETSQATLYLANLQHSRAAQRVIDA